MMDEFLKPGDPCPCCGEPIKTDDPDALLMLNWIVALKGEEMWREKVKGVDKRYEQRGEHSQSAV